MKVSKQTIGRLLLLTGLIASLALGLYAQIGTVEYREGVFLGQGLAWDPFHEHPDNTLQMSILHDGADDISMYYFENETERKNLKIGDRVVVCLQWNIDHPEGIVKGVWKKQTPGTSP